MELEEKTAITFGATRQGWIGDVPDIRLDISKLQSLGWSPKHSIVQAIEKTMDFLMSNDWVVHEKYYRD
jgi:nucleoside-diphosphate-sugar epimerase